MALCRLHTRWRRYTILAHRGPVAGVPVASPCAAPRGETSTICKAGDPGPHRKVCYRDGYTDRQTCQVPVPVLHLSSGTSVTPLLRNATAEVDQTSGSAAVEILAQPSGETIMRRAACLTSCVVPRDARCARIERKFEPVFAMVYLELDFLKLCRAGSIVSQAARRQTESIRQILLSELWLLENFARRGCATVSAISTTHRAAAREPRRRTRPVEGLREGTLSIAQDHLQSHV